MNNLKEVPVGGKAKVVRIHGEGAVKRRIMDMGITRGVEIYVRRWGIPLKSRCADMNCPCGKQMLKASRSNDLFFHRKVRLT